MMKSCATALLVGTVLAGCSSPPRSDAANDTVTAAPAADSSAGGGVTRAEVVAPAPSPTPLQAAVIQSQPGPKGNTVALNKLSVTGDILTATLTFSGGTECCVHLAVDDVSVIDDASSQRISVLKDNAGKWMAAPVDTGGRSVNPESYRSPSVVWFKFPAPPATSKTVSLTLPGVAPFDAVPVTR